MKRILYSTLTLFSLYCFCSCREPEHLPLVNNTVNFESNAIGIGTDDQATTFSVSLDRSEPLPVVTTVKLSSSTLVYGVHYTTEPAATAGLISVVIPAGKTTADIAIVKVAGAIFDPNDKLEFSLTNVAQPCVTGECSNTCLSFSAITSEGGTLRLNGGEGGANAVNMVFVDFSANKQISVLRKSWDFGFYCQPDDFRVILNYTTGASAKAIAKTDLTQVTAADTLGLGSTLVVGMVMESSADMNIVDDVMGDITKTAMTSVSSVTADNKVYIVNPGNAGGVPTREWLKVRVIRKADGYTLQYAKLSESSFRTIDIAKDASYSFRFVSCETNAIVDVETTRAKWDMVWTTGVLPFTTAGRTIPVPYSDVVFCNTLAGVKVATVLVSGGISYEAFSKNNVSVGMFSTSNRATIGSGWRATPMGAGMAGGVKTDRFYVVQDPGGNLYKLRFKNFISADGGERGYPTIEYALLK